MANEQLIDQVISPVVDDQVAGLTKLLADLDIQMVNDIKSANALNTALSNSKSFVDYNKNATQTTLQLEKIQQAQNKTALTAAKLEETNKKIAADEQARQEKALAQLAKRQQAQAAADAKEIAAAEAKAAKLQAIMEAANRKANVQFPATSEKPNPVTEEPSSAMPAGIANASDYEGGIRQTTTATVEQTAAMAEQAEVLAGLSNEYRANLELLLALKAEQAENAIELKALNVEDAVSGERAIYLTAEQLRLKAAIQQTNISLNQQTKEMSAQSGSAIELNAQLAQLRARYDSLSVEERENVAIGGVLLTQIEKLDIATKELSASQGIHNKNVGNYTAATAIAEKVSAQFVRQLVRMAAQFLLVTVAFGAIQWLYDWIKGFDIFTGKLDQAYQNFTALNNVMKSANNIAGDNIANLKILYQTATDVNVAEEKRIEAAEYLKKLYPDILKNSSDAAIMNGNEAASIDLITQSILKEARADAALSELKKIEAQRLDIEFTKEKTRNKLANDLRAAVKKGDIKDDFGQNAQNSVTVQQQVNGLTEIATKNLSQLDKQDQVLKQTEDFLIKMAGDSNIADIIEKGTKDKKGRKPKDDRKQILEEQLRAQKEILDKTLLQENITYQQRLDAVDKFEKNSDKIIQAGEKNKVLTTLQANNLLMGIDNDSTKLRQEINDKFTKTTSEALKKNLEELLNGEKEKMEAAIDILQEASDRQVNILEQQRNKEAAILDDKYNKGKISKKKYDSELLALEDQYNLERLAMVAFTDQTILETKQATLAKQVQDLQGKATPEDIEKMSKDLGIPESQKKLDADNLAVGNAFAKSDKDKAKKPENIGMEIAKKAIQLNIEGIDQVDKLRQKAFEAEIARLEKRAALIEENATNEKQMVNDSIASSATKAREIALIDAQTASAKKAIQAEENKEKSKAAKAEKEATIAKIILQGALAVITALANPFPLNIVMTALTAGAVAIELATAIATPLPTFAQGTKNYPGGLGIWGEAGMERATLPDGSVQYSNGAAIANFPKGTVITPHMELMQQIKPEPVEYIWGEQIGWKEVVKAIKDNKQEKTRNRVNVNVDMGFETYKRSYLRR